MGASADRTAEGAVHSPTGAQHQSPPAHGPAGLGRAEGPSGSQSPRWARRGSVGFASGCCTSAGASVCSLRGGGSHASSPAASPGLRTDPAGAARSPWVPRDCGESFLPALGPAQLIFLSSPTKRVMWDWAGGVGCWEPAATAPARSQTMSDLHLRSSRRRFAHPVTGAAGAKATGSSFPRPAPVRILSLPASTCLVGEQGRPWGGAGAAFPSRCARQAPGMEQTTARLPQGERGACGGQCMKGAALGHAGGSPGAGHKRTAGTLPARVEGGRWWESGV